MQVEILDALTDNFMYLIVDVATNTAAAVDPADAEVAVAAAARLGATITPVLTPHHHYDHAGGNNQMKKLCPSVEVVGGRGENVQGATREVADRECLQLGDAVTITAIHTPAHTAGHTSYLASAPSSSSAVFTGDALFVGGCGRFFEGGPEDMCETMRRLSALPREALVYAGHEYTVKNLQFALEVEPGNSAAQQKIRWAEARRASSEPTVPSTVGDELRFNPFMRVAVPEVRAYCGAADDDVTCMRRLRNKKDNFAGSSRPWVPGGGPLPGL